MKTKDKSIFYTTSYLRSFGIIIGMLIFIGIMLNPIIKKEDRFSQTNGKIVISINGGDVDNVDLARLDIRSDSYYIGLDSKKEVYIQPKSEYFSALREKATVGKMATIWHHREGPYKYDRNKQEGLYIKKMIVDDEIIIPYDNSIGMEVFFIVLAALIIALNVVYVIKNPAHLAGKRDETVI